MGWSLCQPVGGMMHENALVKHQVRYHESGMGDTARQELHDITADALFEMPDDGLRRELVRGAIRTMTPTGGLHGVIVARITVALGHLVEARRLGYVLGAETGFKLATAPDTVRALMSRSFAVSGFPPVGLPRSSGRAHPTSRSKCSHQTIGFTMSTRRSTTGSTAGRARCGSSTRAAGRSPSTGWINHP